MKRTPPPRLALLQAREAPVAVIFRRGPSKLVEVIRWDTSRDEFLRGHWLRGRIYEKRSDLSPDGELLVCFISQFNAHSVADSDYTYAWTAVSKAPWLTALALWPKGDCWFGGGLFLTNRHLWLNHRPEQAVAHPAHPPRGLRVEPNPEARGENEPIYRRRLERDGWTLRQEWEWEFVAMPSGYRTVKPDLRVKRAPRADDGTAIVLARRIDGFRYSESFALEDAPGAVELPPGPVDWMDWDYRGRLIALASGRVWVAQPMTGDTIRFQELIDLRDDRFEEREPPASARVW
ncbi:MAG: hypothetical protein JWO05_1056 [Gemmatimonadetes bacterium]|nr:hypothetical protein [Gemmatimonadota bacterium]